MIKPNQFSSQWSLLTGQLRSLAAATALSTAALASLSELMLFSRSSAFSSRAAIWALFAVVVGAAVGTVVIPVFVTVATQGME